MQPDPPFWSPALARAQLWRTILGFALIFILYAAGTVALTFVSFRPGGRFALEAYFGASPASMVFILASFVCVYPGLWLTLRLLHRRPLGSLTGPLFHLNPRHLIFGILAILAINLATMPTYLVDTLFFPAESLPSFARNPLDEWLIWLPLALILVFFQSTAEELVFRGYLLQQLYARFRSFWIAAVLPSVLFGIGHWSPDTMGPNAPVYVLSTVVSGILASAVTLRTGNLGAAVGLHFANNVLAMILAATEGEMDGLALVTIRMDMTGTYAAYSIILFTLFEITAFALWWRWLNARERNVTRAGV